MVKYGYFILFTLFLGCLQAPAQISHLSRAKLLAETLDTVHADTYHIEAVYFPIKKNLNNPKSPAYNRNPSLQDVLTFAQNQPSYAFNVRPKNEVVSVRIKLYHKIKTDSAGQSIAFSFFILNPNTKQMIELPLAANGSFTEHRSEEIQSILSDPQSILRDAAADKSQMLSLNSAVSYRHIISNLSALVNRHRLYDRKVDLLDIEF